MCTAQHSYPSIYSYSYPRDMARSQCFNLHFCLQWVCTACRSIMLMFDEPRLGHVQDHYFCASCHDYFDREELTWIQ